LSVVSCQALAVGFVTPAFVAAGALLVSIPIIIHILNRRRFRTVEWAAMEFLLRALRKNRRRIRFEQWLLLAVRCCVLLFLGLALARPVGCQDTSLAALAARRAGMHVIVIDNSYSMAYEADRPDAKTHLNQAKLLAKRVVERLSSGGESVVLVTAAQPCVAVIASPTYDLEAARSAIDRVEQSNSGTDLAGALRLARDIADRESRQPNKYLYLLTDATRSAWDAPDQSQSIESFGRELARQYQRITHFSLARPDQWNAAVADIAPANRLVRLGYANDLTATVRGFGNTREAPVQWRLDDQVVAGGTIDNVRPQPDTAPVTQSRFQLTRGGPHVVSVTFAGEDRLGIDDTRRRVVDVAADLKVLIVEGERGVGALSGSGAFLFEALAPAIDNTSGSSAKRSGYLAPELISDLEFGNKVLADYRAVILAGVAQVSPHLADQLKAFVQNGGTLMLFMGEAVNSANYNEVLLPRGLTPGAMIKRVSAAGGQSPFYFDFKPLGSVHHLLDKFKRIEKSGLDTAAVITYWQVEIPADSKVQRVLDFQPNEKRQVDPAITVHDLGQGRVVFVSTSGGPEWSSLPVKSNFAPLVHELLAGSMTAGDAWMNLTVGDELRIPPSVQLTAAPVLRDPDQVELAVEQATLSNGQSVYRSRALAKPGLYTLLTGPTKYPIAVSVPPDEADIRPLDGPRIRRALGNIEIDLEGDQLPPVVQPDDAGNDFGWSFMLAVLGLVGAECFLAMRFGHYRRT
jgi:Mg-chelatase subunit ChlD